MGVIPLECVRLCSSIYAWNELIAMARTKINKEKWHQFELQLLCAMNKKMVVCFGYIQYTIWKQQVDSRATASIRTTLLLTLLKAIPPKPGARFGWTINIMLWFIVVESLMRPKHLKFNSKMNFKLVVC